MTEVSSSVCFSGNRANMHHVEPEPFILNTQSLSRHLSRAMAFKHHHSRLWRRDLDPENELEKLESSSHTSVPKSARIKNGPIFFSGSRNGKQKVLINQSDASRCERL